ncbi:MAG: hypothetical protein Q9175_006303 [Cornicularia normoerica]
MRGHRLLYITILRKPSADDAIAGGVHRASSTMLDLKCSTGLTLNFAIFEFLRAESEQACILYGDTGENKVGFWARFSPVDDILPNVSNNPGDHIAALLNLVNSHQHGT